MASSEGFPAADSEKELNPGQNMDAQVDPISSEIAASKVITFTAIRIIIHMDFTILKKKKKLFCIVGNDLLNVF